MATKKAGAAISRSAISGRVMIDTTRRDQASVSRGVREAASEIAREVVKSRAWAKKPVTTR